MLKLICYFCGMAVLQFVHIPKCAGTSCWDLLNRLSSSTSQSYTPVHHPFQKSISADFTFTIIRDPIERLISFYKFVTKGKCHHLVVRNPLLHKSSLFEFCSYLISINNPEFSNLMTKFISGSLKEETSFVDAISVINNGGFNHIGFVDTYHQTENVLRSFFGSPPSSPSTSSLPRLQQSKLDHIEDQANYKEALSLICQHNLEDIALYSYLLKLKNSDCSAHLFN